MIGEVVTHPLYGRGQVVAVYRNGMEWMVRFDDGIRFRRPRHEFEGQAPVPAGSTLVPSPPAVAAPMSPPMTPPMTPSQFEARQLVEALRVGIAPAQQVRELTIGLQAELASLVAGLNSAHRQSGDARAVLGEYGFGKSHIVELTAQEALARHFLVATASLDLLELPPHRAFDIYATLMRTLRYPDSDERGLAPLLEQATRSRTALDALRDGSPAPLDPLVVALEALRGASGTRARVAWQKWLMGGRRVRLMNRAMPRGIKFPTIYRVGHNARQIAYLLSAISALARLTNYSGLCVLLDEAESYSLLRRRQRPKATLFFKAMLYATHQARQGAISAPITAPISAPISAAELPQHRFRDYPPAYGAGQSLFFLFTVTHSENQLPLDEWLQPEQLILLDPHHTPQEIAEFILHVQSAHARAYGYEPDERHGQVRRAAAELLAQGLRNDRLSLRALVRLTVELYDLLYLHPAYESALLLDELRAQLR